MESPTGSQSQELDFEFDFGSEYLYAGGGAKAPKRRDTGSCNLTLKNGRWILSVHVEDDFYSGDADVTDIIALVTSYQMETEQEKHNGRRTTNDGPTGTGRTSCPGTESRTL
jgi:hypothetical protein